MQAQLPGIDGREEVAPDEGIQEQRDRRERQKDGDDRPRVRQRPVQDSLVAGREPPEAGLEAVGDTSEERRPLRRVMACLPALSCARLRRQQIQHHGGHERAREEIAGEHGEDDGHRQRREQRAPHTAQEEDRHEHDADRQRRDERGRGHLGRAVEDGPPQRFAELHLTVIVLDFDGGVVHEDADGQRHPAQRHHVQRLVQDLEHDDRGQDRERDRRDDDQRAPPRPQEQQDHHRGEAGRDGPLADDARDGRPNEHALIEQEVDLQDLGHQRARAAHHRQRRRAAAAEDRQQHRVAAVAADEVRLGIEPVVDEGDVRHGQQGAVQVADGDLVQVVQDFGAAVDGDVVLTRSDLGRAGRQDDVLGQDRIRHVLGRQSPGVERVGVDVDVDHAHLAAVRRRNGGARNGDELRADEVVAEVVELLLGQDVAAQAGEHDRHAGRVVLDDERRKNAGRELAHDLLRLGVHLGDGRFDRHIGLEIQPGDGDAPQRHGLEVLDPADRGGERSLADGDDSVLHLGRRQPRVVPDDVDDRDVDRREDVDRHGGDRDDAQDGDQQRQHDERIWPAQRESDDPHICALPTLGRGKRSRFGFWRGCAKWTREPCNLCGDSGV